MTEERSVCEYCAGNTKMDDYGQCRACGAPKPTIPQMQRQTQRDYDGRFTMVSSEPYSIMSTAAIDYSMPGGVWHIGDN